MQWFLLALLSAIFLSASSIIEKQVLKKVHAMDFSSAHAVLNFFLSLPFIFFIDWQEVTGIIILFTLTASLFSALAFLLSAKGVRHLELSTVSPLLSLSPGVTAVIAFLVLGEKLHFLGIVGIGFMIIGSYILSSHPHQKLLDPLRTTIRSKYIYFIFLAIIFYSIGSIFDRAILHTFSTALPIYFLFVHFFIALLFIPISGIFGFGLKGIRQGFRDGGIGLFSVSILSMISTFFQMFAIQLVPVALVSGVKRSSSFFTTIIAGELFHENNLKRKIIASCIIIVGSFFIAFGF